MVIDLVDKVVECKSLDCPPFTIDFQRTSNHVPVMDEPSAQAKVHVTNTYIHVIKEIKNLEQFYKAKVLASGSIFDAKVYKVRFGFKPIPLGPDGQKLHPRGPDGSRLDDETSSSDGS